MGRALAGLLKELPGSELRAGQWFEFEDTNGYGMAQPDFFILGRNRIILLECKLSQCEYGWMQMRGLYAPLLKEVYQLPVHSSLVCKNLYTDDGHIVATFDELYDGATWHFLG